MQSLLHHFLFYAKVHPTVLHANIKGILFLSLKFHLIFYIQVLKPLSTLFYITFKNADIMLLWYGMVASWPLFGKHSWSSFRFQWLISCKEGGPEKTTWSATSCKILIPQTQISMLLFRIFTKIMKRGWKANRQRHSHHMKCWQIYSFQILSCVSWVEHEYWARSRIHCDSHEHRCRYSRIHWVRVWFTLPGKDCLPKQQSR